MIKEILLNFDQILRFTTINVWSSHQHKIKQITASANNFKMKMKILAAINASEATTVALAKTAKGIESDNTLSLNPNLCLDNLEKSVRHQGTKQMKYKTKTNKKNF